MAGLTLGLFLFVAGSVGGLVVGKTPFFTILFVGGLALGVISFLGAMVIMTVWVWRER